jgi:hypothetical protein
MRALVGLGLLLWLALLLGCADMRSLIEDLNTRQVTSCIWAAGSYGPFMGVQLLTATGGATLEQCRTLR